MLANTSFNISKKNLCIAFSCLFIFDKLANKNFLLNEYRLIICKDKETILISFLIF